MLWVGTPPSIIKKDMYPHNPYEQKQQQQLWPLILLIPPHYIKSFYLVQRVEDALYWKYLGPFQLK